MKRERARRIILRRRPPNVVMQDAALYAQEVLLQLSERYTDKSPLWALTAGAALRLGMALQYVEDSRR